MLPLIKHHLFTGIFLILSAAAATVHAQSVSVAGRVVFATGNPVATDTAGTQRSLGRGDDVFAGDNLRTPVNSRLQVSFADGAYISLQPNSEYEIEEYKYAGRPDGTESAVYRLIKGGVRAVTGLIGQEEPEAYKVHTAAATIGIRGTGHNTRMCQGDCPGQEDGLYHSTWEGVTYVANNMETVDVPSGRSVFVRDLNSRVRFLRQPPVVTAVRRTEQREEEQRKEEEQSRVVSVSEQRTEEGDQQVIVDEPEPEPERPPTQAITGLGLIAVNHVPPEEDSTQVDVGLHPNAVIFLDADGLPVGGLVDEGDGNVIRSFGTIDLNAMLNAGDATVADEIQALVDGADDPAAFTLLEENPAQVAEFTTISDITTGGVGLGRWAGGRFLIVDDTGETEILALSGFQSLHFLFGSELANPLPAGADVFAFYDFIAGTQSTTVSGDTLGDGVINDNNQSNIAVNFSDASAFLHLEVRHNGNDYFISGPLSVDTMLNELFDNGDVLASAPGTGCDPSCPTFIDGRFFGPTAVDPTGINFPEFAGLEYDIQDDDVIMGVALFGFTPLEPLPTTVSSSSVFVAINPDLDAPGFADQTFGSNSSLFINNNQTFGVLFDDDLSGERVFATIDTEVVLAADDPAVDEVQTLLDIADQTKIDDFEADPAFVADSFFDPTTGIGWGRWTGGRVLVVDDNGAAGTEVLEFTNNQSVHFIYGTDPGPIPTTGTAGYSFAGGTRSTSLSGDTIGDGVQFGGAINVDFGNQDATIDMTVEHINTYDVSGDLGISSASNGIFDLSVAASTTAPGSACNPSCSTFIEGGFAGPDSGGVPQHIGITYQIVETDRITGVAGFAAP